MSADVASEHRWFGAGCTGCDWISTDPRQSLKVAHAEHVTAVLLAENAELRKKRQWWEETCNYWRTAAQEAQGQRDFNAATVGLLENENAELRAALDCMEDECLQVRRRDAVTETHVLGGAATALISEHMKKPNLLRECYCLCGWHGVSKHEHAKHVAAAIRDALLSPTERTECSHRIKPGDYCAACDMYDEPRPTERPTP